MAFPKLFVSWIAQNGWGRSVGRVLTRRPMRVIAGAKGVPTREATT